MASVAVNNFMSPKDFPALPQNCTRNILSFLDPQDLANFSQVSRVCREDASADRLWEDHFGEIKRPEGMSIQKYLGQHGVGSENQLIQRVQEFVNKVQINRRGVYECLFPFNPQYACRLEIGYGIFDRNVESDIKQTDFFALKIDEREGNIQRIEENDFIRLYDHYPVYKKIVARSWLRGITSHLPQNTSQELETIVNNRLRSLEKTQNYIELPFFYWSGCPPNMMDDRDFDVGAGFLVKPIFLPCLRWRASPNKTPLGNVGARVACIICFATAGVLSIAEAVVSLALSVLAFTAGLFLKESQWGRMLLSRSVTALGCGVLYLPYAFVQLFL
ncbi:MAG: F-box-like domain-containing protein [Waddliaceae bacterium]